MCHTPDEIEYYSGERNSTVHNKTAAVSATFVLYCIYSIVLLMAHLLKDRKGKEKQGELLM